MRNNRGDEPARLAHLDDRDQRGFVVQAGGGSAQIVPLRHRALLVCLRQQSCSSLAARPIASSIGVDHRPEASCSTLVQQAVAIGPAPYHSIITPRISANLPELGRKGYQLEPK